MDGVKELVDLTNQSLGEHSKWKAEEYEGYYLEKR
jgi:hypothetical protein